ncbi:alpha-keto acid decarboxylase family protein [Paenibacillus mucilaginosus]|nr:alpha-keto acid decarboxylase family protein [Paenibacillus mucilaginosus]
MTDTDEAGGKFMIAAVNVTEFCTVGDYLIYRMKEVGIEHIFGVPGDFNLHFLDQIEASGEVSWVGNCNELNAAYSADGYARIRGIGALVTTFGVGELSALNGIAGAYAEHVPVIQITGAPSTSASVQGKRIHHTLGDGDYTHFSSMYKEVTVAQTSLTADNAPEEIDRVLAACWLQKRPVYIYLPSDVCYQSVPCPKGPLSLPRFSSDPGRLQSFLTLAAEALNNASFPVILADYEVSRYHLTDALRSFVNHSGYPAASLSMGKGVIDENHPQFIGVYSGKISDPYVSSMIDSADCILSIGVRLNDVVTGGFTHNLPPEKMIELHPSCAQIGQVDYPDVVMSDVLEQLIPRIRRRSMEQANLLSLQARQSPRIEILSPHGSGRISQERFWGMISEFLQPRDVVLADTGTALFGAISIPFPAKASFVAQPLWASIGYSLPALLGTQMAAPDRRNVLLIGDGAFQISAQELSTLLAQRLKPVIFLINNDGYTIERLVHPIDNPYNDIQPWNYDLLPHVFGEFGSFISLRVTDEIQLAEALEKAELSDRLVFIEVVMDRTDAPELLRSFGNILTSGSPVKPLPVS